MDMQLLEDQLDISYNSSLQTQDVGYKTSWKRCMIEMNCTVYLLVAVGRNKESMETETIASARQR